MSSLRLSPGADAPPSAVSETPALTTAPAPQPSPLHPERQAPKLRTGPLRFLFERRVHRTRPEFKELPWTAANGVTVARSIAATIVMLVAIVEHSSTLLLAGLLTSWLLDVVDGLLARWRRRETAIGAQLDILADRLTAMWVVLGVVVLSDASPLTVFAAAAVWVQLSFFDQLLAGQFLRFRHWSPDEFHLQDGSVWRLNWAPAAKVIGNLPLALLAIGGACLWVALGLALALILVRVFSYFRIMLRIERLVTIEGHYDRSTDEAWLGLDGHEDGVLEERSGAVQRRVDRDGKVVAIRYRHASSQLPPSLLEMLPPSEENAA